MAWKTMKVCVCDVCGHRWIPEVEDPPLCPRKACRSTLWNKSGIDGRTKAAKKKKVGHTTGIAKGRTTPGTPRRRPNYLNLWCPEGDLDYLFVLILNKLLKFQGAQNNQNAGNAVLEYATSTRDFRLLGFALGHSRSILRTSDQ
jgi:hypothetical protein